MVLGPHGGLLLEDRRRAPTGLARCREKNLTTGIAKLALGKIPGFARRTTEDERLATAAAKPAPGGFSRRHRRHFIPGLHSGPGRSDTGGEISTLRTVVGSLFGTQPCPGAASVATCRLKLPR